MHLFSIWYILSHLVWTSRNNCLTWIWTGLPFSTNKLLSFLVSIWIIKASRHCPEPQISITILWMFVQKHGLCLHLNCQLALQNCRNPQEPQPRKKIKIKITCWTEMLIMCRKHMILLSFALNENISHSSNSFSKNSSILLLVVRLSRVQWPDCMRMWNQ